MIKKAIYCFDISALSAWVAVMIFCLYQMTTEPPKQITPTLTLPVAIFAFVWFIVIPILFTWYITYYRSSLRQ